MNYLKLQQMKKQGFQPVVRINSDKKITISTYCKIVKLAKNNPEMRFPESFQTWWSVSGKEVYAQYINSLHDRINNNSNF